MSSDMTPKVAGILETGWSSEVVDYPIAGDWTSDGSIFVVGDAAGNIYCFDASCGEKNWTREGIHEGGVLAVCAHPSEPIFATSGQDGSVLIWNCHEAAPHRHIRLGNAWVENLLWSPKGDQLAATISRELRVFGSDGEENWRSEKHPSTVSALGWFDNNEIASTCYGKVTVFDSLCGKINECFEWKGSLISLALSRDGNIIACGSQDNSVHFWRRTTKEDSTMAGYPVKPAALSFDSTGSILATGGGEAVTVWSFLGDGPEGTYPTSLELHEGSITYLSFAPDEMLLASGGKDGLVVIWALDGNGEGGPKGAAMLDEAISGLFWRPDGRAIAALDGAGLITVWGVL